MGRAKNQITDDPLRRITSMSCISGTNTVVLAWDIRSASFRNKASLKGFSISRTQENSTRPTIWLGGLPGGRSKDGHPMIRAFSWNDYTASPGCTYTYTVFAVYNEDFVVPEEQRSLSITIKTEDNQSEHLKHRVFFNKGVAGSQAFANKFPDHVEGKELTDDMKKWLSGGLVESFIDFVNSADEGCTIRGAFYEFAYLPALEALARARERGVEVRIVVHFSRGGPKLRSIVPGNDRVDLDVKFVNKDAAKHMGAKWDKLAKVWYAPSGMDKERRNALLSRFGPRDEDAPFVADAAIDKCGRNLRKSIIRRENCTGLSHNKFLILTRPSGSSSVWMSSSNITLSGLYGQANVAHIIRDEHVAEKFLDYWSKLAEDLPTRELSVWNAEQSGEREVTALSQGDGNLQEIACVMSPRPTNSPVLDVLGDIFDLAKEASCLTVAFTLCNQLKQKLLQTTTARRYVLKERNLQEDATFAKLPCNSVVAGGLLEETENLKGFVKEKLTGINDHVRFLHLKFMLIDPLSACPIVVNGSANFSMSSIVKNDESTVYIQGDTGLADTFFVEFMRLFRHHSFRDAARSKTKKTKAVEAAAAAVAEEEKLHAEGRGGVGEARAPSFWIEEWYDQSSCKWKDRQVLLNVAV